MDASNAPIGTVNLVVASETLISTAGITGLATPRYGMQIKRLPVSRTNRRQ